MDSTVAGKTERYSELLGTCRDASYNANLLTLEVGSRGFIHTNSFDKLYQSFPATRAKQEMARTCLLQSFDYQSFPPAMLLLTRTHCCLTRPFICFCLVSPCVHVALHCPAFYHNALSAIAIIELTVPFELCVDSAVARKAERYSELLGTCRDVGYNANLLTLEVSSRGFIHTDSFDYQSFPATRAKQEMACTCLLQSFRVWCKHN